MTERNLFSTLTLERVLVEMRQRAQILEGETDSRYTLLEEISDLGELKEVLERERINLLLHSTRHSEYECRSALIRSGWDMKLAKDLILTSNHKRYA